MENQKQEIRFIADIAKEIRQTWTKPYFGAVPYINALCMVTSYTTGYGADSIPNIINYFLSNASTWRGEDAKRIKSELKQLLKTL